MLKPVQGPVEGLVLFDLLREAYAERFSGRLHIYSPRERLDILLHRGMALSPSPGVTGQDLALRLGSSLNWPEAQYRLECFTEATGKPEEGLSIPNLILQAVRGIQDKDHLLALLGSEGRRVVLSADPFFRFQQLDLRPPEAYVLSRIEGESSIRDLCRVSALDELETLRALLAFLATGVVDPQEGPNAGRVSAPEVRPEVVTDATAARAANAEPEMLNEVAETLRRFERATYFEMLGVARGASLDQIKRAYFTLAKSFHPDKYYFTKSPALAEQGSRLFARITEAYRTLSNSQLRTRYQSQLEAQSHARKTTPAEPEAPKPPAPTPATARVLRAHGKSAVAAKRYRSAKLATQRSDFGEALEHLREAVRLEPHIAAYQYELGRVLFRMPQRSAEALERFENAVNLEPEVWDYRYALARMYRQLDQPEKAELQFSEARRLKPESSNAGAKAGKGSILSRIFRKSKPR